MKSIIIRGTSYPSQTAAAKALGVTSQAINQADARKTLHRVGLGEMGRDPSKSRRRYDSNLRPIEETN